MKWSKETHGKFNVYFTKSSAVSWIELKEDFSQCWLKFVRCVSEDQHAFASEWDIIICAVRADSGKIGVFTASRDDLQSGPATIVVWIKSLFVEKLYYEIPGVTDKGFVVGLNELVKKTLGVVKESVSSKEVRDALTSLKKKRVVTVYGVKSDNYETMKRLGNFAIPI